MSSKFASNKSIIGSKIIYKEYLESSLDYAKEHLDSFGDGTVIIADRIAHARGRDGRSWSVMPGQLLLTMVLKPDRFDQKSLLELTMALSCSLARACAPYGGSLKWPNDCLIDNKKVAGMLLEIIWKGSVFCGAIVGIGINVTNRFEEDHDLFSRATSLQEYCAEKIDKNLFLKTFLSICDTDYKRFLSQADYSFYPLWRSYQKARGKSIIIHEKSGVKRSGICQDFNSDGSLILNESGRVSTIPFYVARDLQLV